MNKTYNPSPDFPNLQETCERLDNLLGPKRLSPLPYAFPSELMLQDSIPLKRKEFGNRITSTKRYPYGPGQMREYYENYQLSRFGLTTKKGGWEALRHLEICANGCIPLMPDIEKCPPFTMTNAPRHLYLKAWKTWGSRVRIENGSLQTIIPPLVEDKVLYQSMAKKLFSYTRERQTTQKIARWFLDRNNLDHTATVLFIADTKKICYSTELLCHGLRQELGPRLVDIPKLDYLYKSFPPSSYGKLYGHGYGYAGLLPDIDINRGDLKNRLKKSTFDLVVFAQIDRASALLPIVRKQMPPERISLIDGGDQASLPGFPNSTKIKRPWWSYFGLANRDLITIGRLFKREIDTNTLFQFQQLQAN